FETVRSAHGPVVAMTESRALAMRVAGLDRPDLGLQTLRMMKAETMEDFEGAMAMDQSIMFNTIYADRAGNILERYDGRVPQRSGGGWEQWQEIVPGTSRENLWNGYLPGSALPRVANPESGWLQNANEPPWYMTVPYPLRAAEFPAYLAPD